MVNSYFITNVSPNNKRHRHAIYHFFNQNRPNTIISMTPNVFFRNSTLKHGSHATNAQKRNRILQLVGGNPNRAYIILAQVRENRGNEIVNKGLRNRTNGFATSHVGQYNFYNRLYHLFNSTPIGRINLVNAAGRVPNANLVRKLVAYHHNVTTGRNYRNTQTKIRAINNNIRRIRGNL